MSKAPWGRTVVVVLALAAVSTAGGLILASRKVPSPPAAYLHHQVVDLGKVNCDDENLEAIYTLENIGGEELRILHTTSGCACTTVKIDKSAVASGDRASIRARIRANQAGENSVNIVVMTNDPVLPRIDLSARWHAVAGIRFSPAFLELGALKPAEKRTTSVAVEEVAPGVVLVKASTDRDELSANVSPAGDRIDVTLDSGADFGDKEGVITATIGGMASQSVSIPVRWSVRGPLEAVPARLFLGSGAAEQKVHGEVRIVGNLSMLKSLSWDCQGGDNGLSVRSEPAEGAVVLSVSRSLPAGPGFHESQLCLKSGQHELIVPVKCYVLRKGSTEGDSREESQ